MALIETFSDSFANLTNWQATGYNSAAFAATGGEAVWSMTGPVQITLDTTVTAYDFNNSWFSVELTEYASSTDGNSIGFVLGPGAADASDLSCTGQIIYNQATDQLFYVDTYGAAGGTSFANPGVPIILGCKIISGTMVWGYSIDAGATWTVAFVIPYSYTDPAYLNLAASSGDSTTTITMKADNVNLYEPDLSVPPPIDFDLTTTVATVSVVAPVPTGITLGDPYVTFTPAIVSVLARAPLSVTLGPPAPVIDVYPAQVNVVAFSPDPIVGTYVPGDRPESAFNIRESGSMTVDMGDFDTLTPGTQNVWFAYTADAPMQVTFVASGTDPLTVSVYNSPPGEDTLITSSDGTIVIDVVTGITYFQINMTASTSVSVSWTYDPVTNDLMMDVLNPLLDHTPDTLKASVIGGTPGESVRFTWSPPVSTLIPIGTTRPITLATVSSDFEGNIMTATLPLQAAPAGTYIVEARGLTSGRSSVGTFKILNAPFAADSAGSPVEPIESMSVKWLWYDGIEDPWIMAKNPDRMTSVVQTKVLTPEHSTGGGGQHIIWQGATPAVDWSFNGVITTQAEREALEYFYSLNRKFYITTHRNVRYTVAMKNLDLQPKRNGDNFETWDYSVDMLIFTASTPVKKTLLSRWDVGHL